MYKTPISALVLIYTQNMQTQDLQVMIMERADKAGYWQSVTGSLEEHRDALPSSNTRSERRNWPKRT
jgi:hypothetical protein